MGQNLPFIGRFGAVAAASLGGRVAVLIVERPALVCISDRISSAAPPHGVGKAAALIKTGYIFGSLVTYKPPPTTFPFWPIPSVPTSVRQVDPQQLL